MTVDLRAKPFALDDAGVAWVERTLAALTVEEKLGQLFVVLAHSPDLDGLDRQLAVVSPGGFMVRPAPGRLVQAAHRHLQERSAVPLLLAGNLENGGIGVATDGTSFASPLQVAATDDEEVAYRLGLVCGREARAVGANWSFAPIVDLDLNPQNPITNTRTFGSDPHRVARMARAYARGLRECGVAATAKHWPGDGVDGRDQHLLTSVNSLSTEEWEAGFGAVFRELIDGGVDAVMSAHIAQPAWSRALRPGIADAEILPASLARELDVDLLRERLGFNGVIVTDATPMAGFTIPLPREQAVPAAIAAGCDVFLFTLDLEEDVAFMRAGFERGVFDEARLDEAVARILGLKASLGLHGQRPLVPDEEALAVLGSAEHRAWARDCAERAVTLVKDIDGLLPLSAERFPRVLLHVLGDTVAYRGARANTAARFAELLRARGFAVTRSEPPDGAEAQAQAFERSLAARRAEHDLVLYYANVSTMSNQTVARITWEQPMGANVPKFPHDLPTVFVSVANPYHLQDVPRVRTFVNAYTATDEMLEALVGKLLGDSPFVGTSPVDPFCGLWDACL